MATDKSLLDVFVFIIAMIHVSSTNTIIIAMILILFISTIIIASIPILVLISFDGMAALGAA